MECQVLAEDDKHKIHAESIRILAEVGTKFHSPRALKIKKGK
jgi:trimethylamine:corrinoid methyltransferase-like protein